MSRLEITQEGYDRLTEERDQLVSQGRQEISQALKEAIALGDLAENAEYISAREQQEALETRIRQLEEMIRDAIIIDESNLSTSDSIQTGHTVRLRDMIEKKTVTYKIVGTTETDPLNGKISNVCPVGQHLLGHKVGDVVEFPVPAGIAKYKVLGIYV